MTAQSYRILFQQIPGGSLLLLFALLALSGCRGPNHFLAKSMPDSLRVAQRANVQEVDLTKLGTGGNSQIIGPGDVLEVSIAYGLSVDDQAKFKVRVGDDGSGALPEIGSIPLAGYEPQAAEAMIREEATRRGLYKNPSVTVTQSFVRLNKIRVLGSVMKPGEYELHPTSSDVVSAIAAAGGLAEDASESIEIRNPAIGSTGLPFVRNHSDGNVTSASHGSSGEAGRSGMTSYSINLIEAARSGTNTYVVQDGGVIMVKKYDPPPIFVTGLVNRPGPVEYPNGKDLRVLDAVSLAGGLKNQLANKIYVIRPIANSDNPAVIQVSHQGAKHSGAENVLLAPGDVVSIEQTPATVLLDMFQIIRLSVSGSTGPLF